MGLQGGQVSSIGGAESPGAMPRGPCRSARQQQYLGMSRAMERLGKKHVDLGKQTQYLHPKVSKHLKTLFFSKLHGTHGH